MLVLSASSVRCGYQQRSSRVSRSGDGTAIAGSRSTRSRFSHTVVHEPLRSSEPRELPLRKAGEPLAAGEALAPATTAGEPTNGDDADDADDEALGTDGDAVDAELEEEEAAAAEGDAVGVVPLEVEAVAAEVAAGRAAGEALLASSTLTVMATSPRCSWCATGPMPVMATMPTVAPPRPVKVHLDESAWVSGGARER